MNNRHNVVEWRAGAREKWSAERHARHLTYIGFVLTRLPSFSEPRFRDLGDTLDDRRVSVARLQRQTLRQLHSLGSTTGISLRFRRVNSHLRLYLILRIAVNHPELTEERSAMGNRVGHMLPPMYSFQRLDPQGDQHHWRQALDLSWARDAHILIKPEEVYTGHSWTVYYTAFLWQSNMLNDMEALCRALLSFGSDALVDITLVPTGLAAGERDYIDKCTLRMREDMNGARIYHSNRREFEAYDPMPGLRTPLRNYENWLERYSQNPLFLHSIRVFASGDPSGLSQALATSATHSTPSVIPLQKGDPQFDALVQAGQTVDIVPEVRSEWWNAVDRSKSLEKQRPLRAQRFARLADVDEIAAFWRLPIPAKAGFPGFGLDVERAEQSVERPQPYLLLGDFSESTSAANMRATFDREGLTKHGLVVGVPGSGKTTLMFSLLHQLWSSPERDGTIPFIVLEPAKTEYRALKSIPAFRDDMLVFTLGDERTSAFRFNPFEVPEGIPLESHIGRLNACFVGAFNLFDPLPLLLDKAIRQVYEVKGWLDDSVGGEKGVETPTLSDLCRVAVQIINQSGYSDKLRSDFNAALIQRLDSLRRGSKGRMLDTQESIPFDILMRRPVVLELDSLSGSEKSLLMMFILTFVYEYAQAMRHYGSDLQHVLLIEEAHNLIGRQTSSSEYRANPQAESIQLFVRMLAEMRALGQGILIAEQLPTAIAPEAMKQTNLKVLMRMTAMDDRLEIGNTMDLGEEHLKAVTRFRPGQAFVYHEGWDRVRMVQTADFKQDHSVEVPFSNEVLSDLMKPFERQHSRIYMPHPECGIGCEVCDRRTRTQAERFVRSFLEPAGPNSIDALYGTGPICQVFLNEAKRRMEDVYERYGFVEAVFPFCAYAHFLHQVPAYYLADCQQAIDACLCHGTGDEVEHLMLKAGRDVARQLTQEEKNERV